MPPVNPENFEYAFSPRVLVKLREQLGLSQAKLASLLEIPVNAVSRWETGATTPDAHTLAALYSIAMQQDITPEFFARKEAAVQMKERTHGVLAWDYENVGLAEDELVEDWVEMGQYLAALFPGARRNWNLRAYIGFHQWNVKPLLEKYGFQVASSITSFYNVDQQLITDVATACKANPQETLAVLVAKDRDYVESIQQLRRANVEVFLWAKEQCSERLVAAVGLDHVVPWYRPYVVMKCLEVVKQLNGKAISRSEFGNLCKQKLIADEIYPSDVGFSRKNPYGSLLGWLERNGLVKVIAAQGKKDTISIKMLTK